MYRCLGSNTHRSFADIGLKRRPQIETLLEHTGGIEVLSSLIGCTEPIFPEAMSMSIAYFVPCMCLLVTMAHQELLDRIGA